MTPTSLKRALVEVGVLLSVPLLVLAATHVVLAQSSVIDQFREVDRQEPRLREVFPDADRFSFELAELPHFRAYKDTPGGEPALVGLGFFTNELDPKVYGYKTQFWMLVGMTPNGVITGVSIDYHAEPFGYFSIDPPEYSEQFKGKSILEPLEVGGDIDAVSRATITVEAATRAIRQGSRQLIRQFLSERK